MATVRFRKRAGEKKLYTVDYTPWLETAETLNGAALNITPGGGDNPLTGDDVFIMAADKQVTFYLANGDAGTVYTITVVVTTSAGQTKYDDITMQVEP